MIIISYTYYITSILEIMVLMNKFVFLKIYIFDLLKTIIENGKVVHEYASFISIFYFLFYFFDKNKLFI